MKADYKNWIPRGMLWSVSAVTALLIVLFVVFLVSGMTVPAVIAALMLLVSAKCTEWCFHAYNAFSYDGKRKLSRDIIDGTARYVRIPDGGRILDVGCGSGALSIACAKLNPGSSVIGIDRWGKEYASFSAQLCRKNAEAEGVKNVEFRAGNAIKLDFPDECFDAVTSNYVYHNISGKNRQDLLLESLRVLKKGGVFAIHDLMSPRRYGDMRAFMKKLEDMGYEKVCLADTTDGLFMTRSEARRLSLGGSSLLYGRK